MQKKLSREQIVLAIEARNELNARQAKNGDFMSFCLYWDYNFFSKRTFIKIIVDAFQRIHDAYEKGIQRKLAISLPPRAGKSYTSSLFCAFMLGRHPKESIMRCACTSDLYQTLSKSVLNILLDDRWQNLFGEELKSTSVTAWQLKNCSQLASYYGNGVGGNIIGKGASMVAMTDDLYTGIADALSPIYVSMVNDWYDGSFMSRVERRCSTIDIGTRWSKNDIIGRKIDMNMYDEVICISALDENGESYCNEAISTDALLKIKTFIDPNTWEAEFQQNPVDLTGVLLSADELSYCEITDIDGKDFDVNLGVCDTADEGTDNLSLPMVKKIGEKYYLYDVVFTTDKMEITEPRVIGALNANKVQHARFESNNGGKLFAINVSKCSKTNITWKTTTSNKETRIRSDAHWIKNNIVFRKDVAPNSEYAKFIKQLTSYVVGSTKAQHDDAIDSLSLLYRFILDLGLEERYEESEDFKSVDVDLGRLFLW